MNQAPAFFVQMEYIINSQKGTLIDPYAELFLFLLNCKLSMI